MEKIVTDISVPSKMLKQLDFPQGSLSQNFLAEDVRYFLDGHTFSRRVVGRSAGRQRLDQLVRSIDHSLSCLMAGFFLTGRKATYQTMP